MKKLLSRGVLQFTLTCVSLLVWVPVWIIFFGAFMDSTEMTAHLAPIFEGSSDFASWVLLPQYPTLQPYVEVLLDTPAFFVMFWNSCKLVFPTFIGHCIIAVPAAWGFARFHFRGKNLIFYTYIILMLMPFQVTMVSSYLALDRIKLMNTIWSVVLPAAFSTFPVFIMIKCFSDIPKEMIEAVSLDGANEFQIFFHIGLPLGFPGVISALVLSFIENWNAIEQPLIFIKDKALWPLSLYLPELSLEQIGLAFVCSILIMLPAVFVFWIGRRYLEEGISTTGIKG